MSFSRAGFTLLEVLIALMVLSLAVMVCGTGSSGALHAVKELNQRTEALNWLEEIAENGDAGSFPEDGKIKREDLSGEVRSMTLPEDASGMFRDFEIGLVSRGNRPLVRARMFRGFKDEE